jgi:uncharacterized protein YijF (DUF1287 family)
MMGSLFQGSPQAATSYVTTTSDQPKWLQDAIYNQIQLSQNIANKPYQSYDMPTVAELSPLQQQAYKNVVSNQGSWQSGMNAAQSGMQNLAGKTTAGDLTSAQSQYLRPGDVAGNLNAAQQAFGQASSMNPSAAAQPMFSKAAGMDAYGAAQPLLSQAASMSPTSSASPYFNQANQATGQALSGSSLESANPYLNAAAQSSAANVGSYMSPYQQGVLDVIAKQGARNLTENLLPGVSDAFIRAGQFGSSRMGEFGSRALRDTQEAILNQQSQAAQQGYNQALAAAGTDLARQGQLASTAGQLSGTDLSRQLQGAAQYQNLGQAAGQLTGQEQQNLANIGQTSGQLTSQQIQNMTNLGQAQGQLSNQQMQNQISLGQAQSAAGQAQQTLGLNAATNAQQAAAGDLARQQGVLSNIATMAQQEQGMRANDVASLEAAGQAQQAQQQAQLNAAKSQFDAEQQYAKQQADWLSTQVRGLAPITPQVTSQSGQTMGATYSPSPLSQIAGAYSGYRALGGT